MSTSTPVETAEIKSKRQAVRLKFLLGEMVLGSWHPDLVVMTPTGAGTPDWPVGPDRLAAQLPTSADGYFLRKVSATKLPTGVGRYGEFLLYVSHQDILHYVQVENSFDTYLGTFSSKTRQNLARSARNFLKPDGVAGKVEIATTPEEIARFHQEAVEISSLTYQTKMLDAGMPPSAQYRAHMVEMAKRGQARGYLLRDATQAIAFAWCVLEDGRLTYNIIGYRPEQAKLSPGTVLLYLLLKDVFDNQVCHIVDFGPGEAQYKSMFATHSEEFVDAYVLRRSAGTWMRLHVHHRLSAFSSATGLLLERLGAKKRIKAWLRAMRD